MPNGRGSRLLQLPNEILLRIMEDLRDHPTSFLPLMHTCGSLRRLVIAADGRLCRSSLYDLDGPFGLLMDNGTMLQGWAFLGKQFLPPNLLQLLWRARSATDFKELTKPFEKPEIYKALFSEDDAIGIFQDSPTHPLQDTSPHHALRFLRAMFMLSRALTNRNRKPSPSRNLDFFLLSPTLAPLLGALIQHLDEFCYAITTTFIVPRIINPPTDSERCKNLLRDCAIAWGPRVFADMVRGTKLYDDQDAFMSDFINRYWRKGLDYRTHLNMPLTSISQGSAVGESVKRRNQFTYDLDARETYLHLFTITEEDYDNLDDMLIFPKPMSMPLPPPLPMSMDQHHQQQQYQQHQDPSSTSSSSFMPYAATPSKTTIIKLKLDQWSKMVPDDEALIKIFIIGKDGEELTV